MLHEGTGQELHFLCLFSSPQAGLSLQQRQKQDPCLAEQWFTLSSVPNRDSGAEEYFITTCKPESESTLQCIRTAGSCSEPFAVAFSGIPVFPLHNLLVQKVQMWICLDLLLGISPNSKLNLPQHVLCHQRSLSTFHQTKHLYRAQREERHPTNTEFSSKMMKWPCFAQIQIKHFAHLPLPKYHIQAVSWSCCIPLRRLLMFIDSPSSYRRKFGTLS